VNALRDGQIDDVAEAALRVEGVESWLDLWVYAPDGALVIGPGGPPPPALAAALGPLSRRAVDAGAAWAWLPEGDPTHLLLVTPLLSDDGDLRGQLALARPLADLQADLRRTAGGAMGTLGVYLLLATGLGLVLGHRTITAPLDGLRRRMDRVTELPTGPPPAGDDEVAELDRRFWRLQAELAEARARADREADAAREALGWLHAADRLISVGRLSAAVAHEVGSPLQVLHGRARALADQADDPARVRRHAEVLVRETERISRVVDQLLSLTRRRPPRPGPVPLGAAAAQVVELLALQARSKGISLQGPPVVPGPAAWADPDAAQQIVLNLVLNAIQACPPGATIEVRVSTDGDHSALEVRDTGPGMSPEVAARCREALFTTRAAEGGTGLGLAVVDGLVRELGGELRLRTSPGQGATFIVRLPTGPAAGSPDPESP